MIWHAPDKPMRIYNLKNVVDRVYIAQTKKDGHCAVVVSDAPARGGLQVLSRHQKPIRNFPAELLDALKAQNIPEGTVLIGEFTGRRQADPRKSIAFFSSHYQAFGWLGMKDETTRWEIARDTIKDNELIYVLPCVDTDYDKLFKAGVGDYTTEGIVLKHKEARLIGAVTSADNPRFMKLKWRDGDDGNLLTPVSDENLTFQRGT